MHTATADHILNRMPEVLKIRIRTASESVREYIRQTTVGYGEITVEVMQEMQDKLTAKFEAWDSTLDMVPSTWKW